MSIMAGKILLQSGSYTELKEMGSFGRPMHALFAQLQEFLRTELGPEAATLLAEPVIDQQQKLIDWYTEGDAEVVPYLQLPPERQQQVSARVSALLATMQEVATRYRHHPDPNWAQFGLILQTVVQHPAAKNLFVAGE